MLKKFWHNISSCFLTFMWFWIYFCYSITKLLIKTTKFLFLFTFYFLVILILQFSSICCLCILAGLDLNHPVQLARRHVGRSCVGIGWMTSTVFCFLSLPLPYPPTLYKAFLFYAWHEPFIGFWNWALYWSLEGHPRRIRLLFWLMLSEWWISYVVKPRSWRTQIQVSRRRLRNWR